MKHHTRRTWTVAPLYVCVCESLTCKAAQSLVHTGRTWMALHLKGAFNWSEQCIVAKYCEKITWLGAKLLMQYWNKHCRMSGTNTSINNKPWWQASEERSTIASLNVYGTAPNHKSKTAMATLVQLQSYCLFILNHIFCHKLARLLWSCSNPSLQVFFYCKERKRGTQIYLQADRWMEQYQQIEKDKEKR